MTRAALKPFADFLDACEERIAAYDGPGSYVASVQRPDDEVWQSCDGAEITWGDLRRARAAYEAIDNTGLIVGVAVVVCSLVNIAIVASSIWSIL